MRRRRFLETAVAAAAAVGILPSNLLAMPAIGAGWTWVHGGRDRSADEWRARFARLREAGITGVLVSGGDAALLSDAAHASDLTFHRWIWILNRNGDTWAQENHPEWFTVSRNGESTLVKPPYVGYYKWVCPTRPPVRQYLRELVGRVAREPGVDGVHLDYVRHCDVILPVGLWEKYDLVQDREYPEFDFCYCDVCRTTFEERTGIDPVDLSDAAPTHVAWREFRWNSVTELVAELAEEVRARGRLISAAVFPTPSIARRLVRQAWEHWPLDMVFPMLYHSFYEEDLAWIGASVREGAAALPPGRSLHAGLYLPSLTPAQLAEATRNSLAAGAAGVSCFEMEGLSDDHLSQFADALR